MITAAMVQAVAPRAEQPDEWAGHFNDLLPLYGFSAIGGVGSFLGQTAHESCGFTRLVENLNYSAEGLMGTWPSRFPSARAKAYARQPELIANFVYASRNGNGAPSSGDGWRFRGRGLIQITGRDNYEAAAAALHLPLAYLLDYAETPRGAVEVSAWWWQAHGCHEIWRDTTRLTRRINGALKGLDERVQLTATAQQALLAAA